MKNLIKRIIGYSRYKATFLDGKGFIQGVGFDVEADMVEIKILGLKWIENISFDVKGEWMRDLKKRWVEDEEQQKLENS